MMRLFTRFLGAGLCLWPAVLPAQDDTLSVEFVVDTLDAGTYLLRIPKPVGRALVGNMLVVRGDSGALLVDAGVPPIADRLQQLVMSLGGPVRHVVTTHPHLDHIGSVPSFVDRGATHVTAIVERGARTVADSIEIDIGSGSVHVFHPPPSHTAADLVVWVPTANVIHLGDLWVGGYPFLDVTRGGSIDGVIGAVDWALARADSATTVIGGHGQPGNLEQLRGFREMLGIVRERIRHAVDAGRSEDEAIALEPSKEFDDSMSGGFVRPDVWVRQVFRGMKTP